jgi:hypothetical protein
MIQRHLPAVLPHREADPPVVAVLVWCLWLAAVLGLVWGLAGCDTIHIVLPQIPTPVPVATPTPKTEVPTPTPLPAEPFQATSGRAVLEIDLTDFQPAPMDVGTGLQLDYYAAATLLWTDPPVSTSNPDTPALELSIRGTSPDLCVRAPCGPRALGLVARWSANVRHDGVVPDEHAHCGQGIVYSQRLPLGAGPVVRVVVAWRPGQVSVSTGHGTWTTSKGAAGPGFGRVYTPLPRDRGIGWARQPWVLQRHGGTARLLSWEADAENPPLGACP